MLSDFIRENITKTDACAAFFNIGKLISSVIVENKKHNIRLFISGNTPYIEKKFALVELGKFCMDEYE